MAAWCAVIRNNRVTTRNDGQVGRTGLTARQRELLHLLAQGRDDAQIAATLSLSVKTVRHQTSARYAKLGVAPFGGSAHQPNGSQR
ncbi:MAG: response regulator transcription factor [Piscinibacter sp.]|nr:response regulator transcription factor [Piscinibacter sp.]